MQKYVVAFLAVFLIFILLTVALTNYLLSGAISRMILKPLRILKLGAREIAGGNLDFRPDYAKDDKFGGVCREFDRMRARLKESVAEKLRYENYRRELLSGISHDLRTPLTAIRGYAEGLTDGVADTPEKQRKYCQAIRSGTMEVEALADSLLLFSRLENKRYRYCRERVRLDGCLDACSSADARWRWRGGNTNCFCSSPPIPTSFFPARRCSSAFGAKILLAVRLPLPCTSIVFATRSKRILPPRIYRNGLGRGLSLYG